MHLENRESESAQLDANQFLAAAFEPHQLLNVLDTINDRVFLKDLSGCITFANRAFLSAYGLQSHDVIGKHMHSFLPTEMIEPCLTADDWVVREGQPICLETDWVDQQTGKHYWSETHKSPIRDAKGNTTGIVGVSRDISARRRAEEESKRSKTLLLHAARLSSLGEMAAGIAHEVNQPLFSIVNYAKAIQNTLNEDGECDLNAIKKWIDQIHREATRGGVITQRLKSFSKPSESQREESDLNTVVNESVEFMALEARDANIEITKQLAADLPRVYLDRVQIQQVLVNLMKNAFDACEDSTSDNPRVTITTQSRDSQVEVLVSDNGVGLSAIGDINIFDAFQSTKNKGTGLGLTICKIIIDAHKGALTFAANSDRGATFQFWLPI